MVIAMVKEYALICGAFVVAALVIGAGFFILINRQQEKIEYSGTLQTFKSQDELNKFVRRGYSYTGYDGGVSFSPSAPCQNCERSGSLSPISAPSTGTGSGTPPEYSHTNVQVGGVDEADIVKTDGNYIYKIVSGESVYYSSERSDESKNKVVIIKAELNGSMNIVSEVIVNSSVYISGLYINDDRMVIIGNIWYWGYYYGDYASGAYSEPTTSVYIYDISNINSPKEKYSYNIRGYYFDSRMINKWVYVITQQWLYIYNENQSIPLPVIEKDGTKREIPATEIQYVDAPEPAYEYTIITAIDNARGDYDEKEILMGYSSTIYVSRTNIYLTVTNWWRIWSWQRDNRNEPPAQETTIYKFGIKGKDITFKASGNVRGHVLNKYSMDEYLEMNLNKNYFRIATTKSAIWWFTNRTESENNVYILDENMHIVGKLEGIAKGERIYSVRFLNKVVVLVTFRQIDPLFVIDVSTATAPKVLGFLKVPGVSTYLHPYDDNYIIGVGYDATEQGRITGLKIALFNITDFANPTEISKYIIEHAYSSANFDPHAFLFSKSKNLLVIPVEKYSYMDYSSSFSGVYVFNITSQNGIVYRGNISHEPENYRGMIYYYSYYNRGNEVYASKGDLITVTLNTADDNQWLLGEDYNQSVLQLVKNNISTTTSGLSLVAA